MGSEDATAKKSSGQSHTDVGVPNIYRQILEPRPRQSFGIFYLWIVGGIVNQNIHSAELRQDLATRIDNRSFICDIRCQSNTFHLVVRGQPSSPLRRIRNCKVQKNDMSTSDRENLPVLIAQ